ncbi:MAG: NRDE family protein [Deltaproteobacteria bacterium]|nr:NRDE family protein [Deltaproteobacteria bacterium]
MCLILFAHKAHPEYPLVVAANRDEFYNRPTRPMTFWRNDPDLLAGRDLEAGGTWLGVTRSGRFAAITNYRNPKSVNDNAPSRGQLVTDYLVGHNSPEHYLARLRGTADRYNGFNLLVANFEGLYFFSNRNGRIEKLSPGIYGLSNQLLDTPWPKVEIGKAGLVKLLSGADLLHVEDLFDLLAQRRQAPDDRLPDTGIGIEWERILSPLFIESPDYGTRSSTVLVMNKSGRVTIAERTFDPLILNKNEPITRHFAFQIT